jgi:hypothetical protein
MPSHLHFAVFASYLLLGIVLLLWVMLCAVTAERLEKEGLPFRTGFLLCAMFTPLAGVIAARVLVAQRASRPLAARSLQS